MDPLNDLLEAAKGRPASYLSELFRLTADIYAVDLGEDHASVVGIRHSSWAVGLMRGLDAEEAWRKDRKELPWWKRLTVRLDPPGAYVTLYVRNQQERARIDIEKAGY